MGEDKTKEKRLLIQWEFSSVRSRPDKVSEMVPLPLTLFYIPYVRQKNIINKIPFNIKKSLRTLQIDP